MSDPVNAPAHYLRKGYELTEIVLAFELNWCRGNVLKYVLRAGKKADELEDLRKAAWYLSREIRRLEGKHEQT